MAIEGLPYRGWYNGNVELMRANGTYADFRHMLEKQVELGKLKAEDLAEYDRQWDAVSMEDRIARRNLVVENSTPREVTVQTHEGTITSLKTVPDENDNIYKERQKEKVKRKIKLPAGAITAENSPLVKESKKPVPPSAE